MIQSPIHKVLSTLVSRRVRYLLMGGQACVFYGAAEFSRDTDVMILARPDNIRRLRQALNDLRAECIAVPPMAIDYLRRGHAIHFRCWHPDAPGIRLDVMSVLRGVGDFPTLWKRRTTMRLSAEEQWPIMALTDLVQTKKTQRDKDWFMLRRLMEAHYAQHHRRPWPAQVRFWFREMRTSSLLIALARHHPRQLEAMRRYRPFLRYARTGNESLLAQALAREEALEREADRQYWQPLKAELERLRHDRLKTE